MVCWKVPVKGKGWWAFRGWKKPARAGPVVGCGRVALGGRCRCPWLATLHQSYPRFAPYKNSKRNMNHEGKERGEPVWGPAPPPESRTQQRRSYSQLTARILS